MHLCLSLGCEKDVLTLLRLAINHGSPEINHNLICREKIALSICGLNPIVKSVVSDNRVLVSAKVLGTSLSVLFEEST